MDDAIDVDWTDEDEPTRESAALKSYVVKIGARDGTPGDADELLVRVMAERAEGGEDSAVGQVYGILDSRYTALDAWEDEEYVKPGQRTQSTAAVQAALDASRETVNAQAAAIKAVVQQCHDTARMLAHATALLLNVGGNR